MDHAENFSFAMKDWTAKLGPSSVLDGMEAQKAYGLCTTGAKRSIAGAVYPINASDVVAVINIACEYHIPLYPISTGQNWGYGTALPVTNGCVIVDLSRMKRIVEMDADSGLVTLEPGVTQGDLRNYLDQKGLPFMVPTTGAGPTCSLVGNALERGYGITPHADHFGAVTALEAVLPNGEVYRSALSELGGNDVDKAFKWGLGPYIDGLFAQGNIGVVTQMTIALARRPERMEAFFFSLREDAKLEAAVLSVQKILRSLNGITGSINLINSRRALAMAMPYPKNLVGKEGILPDETIAVLADQYRVAPWTGVGALYGEARVVKAAKKAIKRILSNTVAQMIFIGPGAASCLNGILNHIPTFLPGNLIKKLSTMNASLDLMAGNPSEVAMPLAYWKSGILPEKNNKNPAKDGCGLIWYAPLIPMKPERVRKYVTMVNDICRKHAIESLITLTSLSDRCFDSSVPLLFDPQDPKQTGQANACYQALLVAGLQEGFVPYRMGIHAMQHMTGSGTSFWKTVDKIKKSLDPENIIAPGRYCP